MVVENIHISHGINFERIKGKVWIFKEKDTRKISELVGLTLREDLPRAIRPEEVSVVASGGSLDSLFIQGTKLVDVITEKFELNKATGNVWESKGVRFERISTFNSVNWSFLRSDASKVALVIGAKLQDNLRKATADDVVITEKGLTNIYVGVARLRKKINKLFGLDLEKGNVVEKEGIRFERVTVGVSKRRAWSFPKKDIKKMAELTGGALALIGLREIADDDIPVFARSLAVTFVAGGNHLKKFVEFFGLEKAPADSVLYESHGVKFERVLNDGVMIWSFKETERFKIEILMGLKLRELREIGDDEIPVSKSKFNELFVNGEMLTKSFREFFGLDNTSETFCERKGIRFELVMRNGRPIWAFKKEELSEICRLTKYVIKRNDLREINKEVEIEIAHNELKPYFVSSKGLGKTILDYFELNSVSEIKIEREGVHFELVKSGKRNIWTFPKAELKLVSKLTGLRLIGELPRQLAAGEVWVGPVALAKLFISGDSMPEDLRKFFGLDKAEGDIVISHDIQFTRVSNKQRIVSWAFSKEDIDRVSELTGYRKRIESLRKIHDDEIAVSQVGLRAVLANGSVRSWEKFRKTFELDKAKENIYISKGVRFERVSIGSNMDIWAFSYSDLDKVSLLLNIPKASDCTRDVTHNDILVQGPALAEMFVNGDELYSEFEDFFDLSTLNGGIKESNGVKFELVWSRYKRAAWVFPKEQLEKVAEITGYKLRRDTIEEDEDVKTLTPALSGHPDVLLSFLTILKGNKYTPDEIKEFVRNFQELNLRELAKFRGGRKSYVSDSLIRWLLKEASLVNKKPDRDRRVLIEAFQKVIFLELMNLDRRSEILAELQSHIGLGLFFKELYESVLNLATVAINYESDHIRSVLEPHQRVGAYALSQHDRFYLGDATGLGKTLEILAALNPQWKTFVAVPANLIDKWEEEVKKHFKPEVLQQTNIIILKGSWEQKKALIESTRNLKNCIIIGSIQGLRNKSDADLEPLLNGLDLTVVDEVQYIANWRGNGIKRNSQQANALQRIMTASRKVWMASATGYSSNPYELYSVLYALSPQDFPSYREFKREFNLNTTEGYIYLRDKIQKVSLIRDKDDVMLRYEDPASIPFSQQGRRLPTLVDIPYTEKGGFPLSLEQHELLFKMISNFREFAREYNDGLPQDDPRRLKDKDMNPFTKLRFIQTLMIDPKRVGGKEESPLWQELKKVINTYRDETGHLKSGIIFIHNHYVREIVADLLTREGIRFEQIHGYLSVEERAKARADFQDGKVPLVIVSDRVGGEGHDLTAAEYMVHVQLPETYPREIQLRGRAERMDGDHPHWKVDEINMIGLLDRNWLKANENGRYNVWIKANEKGLSPMELQKERLEKQKNAFEFLRLGIGNRRDKNVFNAQWLASSIPGFMQDPTMAQYTNSLKSDKLRDILDKFLPYFENATSNEQREKVIRLAELFAQSGDDMDDEDIIAILLGDGHEEILDNLESLKEIPNKYVRSLWLDRLKRTIVDNFADEDSQDLLAGFESISDDAPFLVLPLFEISQGFEDEKALEVINKLISETIQTYSNNRNKKREILIAMATWLSAVDRTVSGSDAREVLGRLLMKTANIFADQGIPLDNRLNLFKELLGIVVYSKTDTVEISLLQMMDNVKKEAAKEIFGLSNQEADNFISNFKANSTALHIAIRLKQDGHYQRQFGQLVEIVKHISDGDFKTWRNEQEGERLSGAKVEFLKDDKDFWDEFTREENVSLGNVDLNDENFRKQLKSEAAEVKSVLSDQRANFLREVDGDWVASMFGETKDSPESIVESRKKLAKVLDVVDQTLSEADLEVLQSEGLSTEAGDLRMSIEERLTEYNKLSQWLSLWAWLKAVVAEKRLGDDELISRSLLISKLSHRAEIAGGVALTDRLENIKFLLDSLDRKSKFRNITVRFTSDPNLVMQRGQLAVDLIDCFNEFADLKQVSTLVDDLGSRNKMMAVVYEGDPVDGRILARGMIKVRQMESKAPVIFIEKTLHQRGHDFENEIALAWSKRQFNRLKDVPLGHEEANGSQKLYDTGGYSEFEYFEPLFGVRERSTAGGDVYHSADVAMTGVVNLHRGGIDLTSDKALQVQNSGEEIKFKIDPGMLEKLKNDAGFVPVIINIQPMTNLRRFLELTDN